MSFVDLRFLFFFPTVVLLNVLLPIRFRWILLLAASYLFYMAWKPEYGLLLFLITSLDFAAGYAMGQTGNAKWRRVFLLASLAGNLGLLFYFKYFNFVLSSIGGALDTIGVSAALPVLDILLPIGISFHVFQSISYTIDVYRQRVAPVSHFGKFALYVSFFPQLVAGPIERPDRLLKQFFEDRRFDVTKAREGFLLMLVGFFKKLVVADNLAPLVNAAYADPTSFPGPTLALATVLFAYQIYCDFSGYTDIARGAAKILGYDLMKNFDRPYASTSVTEFWRRWHISLSSWFRDYVYIPLGGNRVSTSRTYFNLLITFLLSGLWHGANWTFVIWGGLNGLYLVIEKLFDGLRARDARNPTRAGRALRHVFMFGLITLTWIFFRARSLPEALYILTHIPTGTSDFVFALLSAEGQVHVLGMGVGLSGLMIGASGILALECAEYLHSRYGIGFRIARLRPPSRIALYAAVACAVLFLGALGSPQQFIYFQF